MGSPLNPESEIVGAVVVIGEDDFGCVGEGIDCPGLVQVEDVWRVDLDGIDGELVAGVDVGENGFVIFYSFYPLSLAEPGEKVVASSSRLHNIFNRSK